MTRPPGPPHRFEVAARIARERLVAIVRSEDAETAAAVAEALNEFVQTDASDGFILVPHITPGGLDEFADTVVPLLQERGVFRTEYEGDTLRDHLGLRTPGRDDEREGRRAVAS